MLTSRHLGINILFFSPHHHNQCPLSRLASILVEFAREVKEAHMIILAEETNKKVLFSSLAKAQKEPL